jgi:ubiquitin-conjugating enzyme E2 D/E
LLEFRKLYPNCILRIIALTDGEDNSKHGVAPILVAETIKKNDIILDSFVVND